MKMNKELTLKHSKLQQDEDAFVEEIMSFFNDGGTIGMLQGIDDELLEQMYSVAYYQYDSEDYEQASKTFQVLCLLNHYQPKFYLGLGACQQQQAFYESAIDSYSFAAILDVTDPRAPYHAGECYIKLRQFDKADQSLKMAAELSKNTIKYQQINKNIGEKISLLASINNNNNKNAEVKYGKH